MKTAIETTTRQNNIDLMVDSMLGRFGTMDYIVFIAMLSICSIIGVYFGIEHSKQQKHAKRRDSVELDFLVGGRKMSVFPVSMSIIATWISGITLMGTSTETYLFGTGFMTILGAIIICGFLVHFFFLPVFVEMQLTSLYEYLEARFDRRLRLLGSVLFIISQFSYLPVVIYVPALAFNQVTGIGIHIITPAICIICIFYTGLGGIKAVVWTDFIQIMIMYGTVATIIIKGTLDVGGFGVVFERNYNTGRIEFPPFDLDPTIRHSFFSLVFGGGIYWSAGLGVSQALVQRYLSLPDIRAAKKSLWIFIVGSTIMIYACCYNGLLIFATYYDCDPLSTKLAKAKDQLVPLYIMDIFRNVPGLPGLFVSGIFSAALSSLSTGLNSLSAIVLEDFVKPNVKTPLTGKQTDNVMRGVVVIVGILCVVLVFIVERMGAVLQLTYSLGGVTVGPLFGIFVMGLTMPWINNKSALIGGVSSLLITGFMAVKTQALQAAGQIILPTKPVTTDGCTYEFDNSTIILAPISQSPSDKSIYHLSYMYSTLLGFLIAVIVSHLAIILVGCQNRDELDRNLLSPIIRRWIQPNAVKIQNIEMTHKFKTKDLVDNTERDD